MTEEEQPLWYGSATPGVAAPSGWMTPTEAAAVSDSLMQEFSHANSQDKTRLFREVLRRMRAAEAQLDAGGTPMNTQPE